MSSPSFQDLRSKKARGHLSLTFILGLPRGGTTAIEKHLYSHLPFDANINEPSLHLDLGVPETGLGDDRAAREEATFSSVVQTVNEAEKKAAARGRSVDSSPLRVLVKEVTNKVLPWMVPLWAELADCVVVIYRNPGLQFESRLKSIVDRVKSGALSSFGISDASCGLAVHGRAVLLADSGRPFADAYGGMCKERDFSGFAAGLPRLASLHPFCADPECQKIIWGPTAPQPPPTLDSFEALTDAQCDELLDWRMGWRPLREQLQRLRSHPRVVLLDFSAFQVAPPHLTEAVASALRSVCPGWAEAEAARQRGSADAFEVRDEGGAGARRWDDAQWQAWYGQPCFGKVTRRNEVEPVLKAPPPASSFPTGIQAALRDACHLYAELCADSRAVNPPVASAAQFVGIDPLYDAAHQPGATSDSRRAAANVYLSGGNPSSTAVGDGEQWFKRLGNMLALVIVQTVMLCQTAMLFVVCRYLQSSPIPPAPPLSPSAAVTVIMPCLNEEASVATALHSIRGVTDEGRKVEVVVVDAGCSDGTMEVVRRVGSAEDFPFDVKRVVAEKRGRGQALRAGVAAATGDILLFLHADCTLPRGWDVSVADGLSSGAFATAFRFQLSRQQLAGPSTVSLRFMEWSVLVRSSVLQLPFGDQAIAMRRELLEAAGGVPDVPILEDYILMVRLMKAGAPGIRVLPSPAACSPRRFEHKGMWQANLLNQVVMLSFRLGVTPESLYRFYYGRSP
eukprot:TRINITY_DN13092_c0_g1_i2.p1 TRINITY_DN13092_c0_g1~~TRINITY_DN13092_c0_g1_i2.p1  ORF type:complete len:736 (+),score=216.72 TRINITY_DN13092_c0_g1_i2:61-2268(+)